MHSQSTSVHSSSTAGTLPYDILREIFLYCSSDSPLDELQPNTKIAPMLLCHVCSSWRTVALESPPLWSHLHYRLPIRWQHEHAFAWDMKTLRRDVECLAWWRENSGSMAPFIHFKFYEQEQRGSPEDVLLTGSTADPGPMTFFVEYLSSAQYLDVGRFIQHLLQKDTTSQVVCSNLHSLVTRYPNNEDDTQMLRMPFLLPFHITPTLRRLSLHRIKVNMGDGFKDWSRLTHLSFQSVGFQSPFVWHCLIRGVPNLQWGYFNIFFQLPNARHHKSSKFTLPFLSTLSVTVVTRNMNELLFVQLFENLHLPSLHDLSIYTEAGPSCNFPDDAIKINDGLKYAPAVTKLTLGLDFDEFEAIIPGTSDWDDVEKLSSVVPHLAHLVLDISFLSEIVGHEIPLPQRLGYWEELLHPGRWLDQANPASTIRKITAMVKVPSIDGPLVETVLRRALELDTQEHHKEADDVVFEIIARDKGRLSPDAEGWKTWGCSL